ncbi:MAG: hypothetical protein PHE02_14345 [Lachnospiraceae bacterium]|nr:hypothetical protein [Lachnospiraceae bacterium]
MNEDTKHLLEQCTSGCKMAVESMNQIKGYIKDQKLLDIVTNCVEQHEELEEVAANLLDEVGDEEKEPGMMATAFSWITTEMKMMMENDNHQAAKLMMDGCNMGIQKICEYQNQYTQASEEAKDIARKLVRIEEDFMGEMKAFI